MARNRIEQEILIKVVGGKELDALDKQIKDLIKQKAKIQVDADASDAKKQLDAIDKQVADLEKQKAEIEVTADTDDADKKIEEIDKHLADLKGQKTELDIQVKADIDEADRKLAELDTRLADLRGEKAELVVEAQVSQALAALDDVAAEARDAKAAADALGTALGPELTAKADLESIVTDLRNTGLTFKDVADHAERFGDKLRDIATADPGGSLNDSFRRARGSIDGVFQSASSSKSVLANMVGNSVQDLGALAGVAGGAGVAIGQMGEYMADARASGEKFGSIIKNFAGMVLPIAGIATAVQLVGKYMKGLADTKAFEKKRIEDFAEALDDAKLSAEELQDVLSEGGDNKILQRIGTDTRDVDTSVGHLFGTLKNFNDQIARGQDGYDAWAQSLLDTAENSGATSRQLQQMKFVLDEARDGAVDNTVASVAQSAGMNTVMEAAVALASAIKNTSEGTEDAAFNNLFYAETTDEAADSQTGFGDKLKATWDKLGRVNDKQQEAADAADDWAIALAGAQDEVNDLADVFSQMEIREGVLSSIFELGNAPLDALGEIRDVEDGIRELGDFIKEEGVPNIFSASDVDAGPFLDKIAALRGPIQEQITAAFAGGGDWQAVADEWVNKIYFALGGKISKGEIETLLGLGDLEAQIDVALKQSAVESVKRQLEILVGLQGDSPWTASIELALDAGEISPEAAEILVQAQLEGAGVLIPTALDTPDTAAAKREAEAWARRMNLSIPSKVATPTGTAAAYSSAQRTLASYGPLIIGARVVAGAQVRYDAGGTVTGDGGIAGERGPEILDGKYLTAGPTYVPPGTRVTSRRRTQVILNRNGGDGLRRYDSGGTVVAGPRTINVNVNAAVVGNRFDVARAVSRANGDIARLMGTRG